MIDSDVARVAFMVRRACEIYVATDLEQRSNSRSPDKLAGLCALASSVLVEELNARGLSSEFCTGFYINQDGVYLDHCWAVFGGLVVDVTRTQFGAKFGKISIVPPGRRYEAEKVGYSALEQVLEWPYGQAPTENRKQKIRCKIQFNPQNPKPLKKCGAASWK